MAGKTGVYLSGLRETSAAMVKAGVEVEELKDVMGTVAAEAATVMGGFIPVATGNLKRTIRGNRAKGNATVTVGTARVNYAWAVRRAHPFVEQTDTAMADRTPQILESGWAAIAERNGLT